MEQRKHTQEPCFVRPSFPMMAITTSMMMILSRLVDPMGAGVANQFNRCRAG